MDLFADAEDFFKIIIFLIVGAAWVVRAIAQAKPDKPARGGQGGGARRPAQRQSKEELDDFLDELVGNRKKSSAPRRTSRPQRRSARQPQTSQRTYERPAAEQEEHRAQVRERHLHSTLESRSVEVMHSGLEEKHIEPHLRPQQEAALAAMKATAARTTPLVVTQQPLQVSALLKSREQLPSAFILGQVLGSPVGLTGPRI